MVHRRSGESGGIPGLGQGFLYHRQSIAIDGGLSLPGLAETAAETAASGWGRVKKEIRWQDA